MWASKEAGGSVLLGTDPKEGECTGPKEGTVDTEAATGHFKDKGNIQSPLFHDQTAAGDTVTNIDRNQFEPILMSLSFV